MLIGCITGPDLETAKRQLSEFEGICDGVEIRADLIKGKHATPQGFHLITNGDYSTLSTGKTISSYHNFTETPENLEEILHSMPTADIYKIATYANSISDALKMIAFTRSRPNVLGICMGPLGEITRILSPIILNPFNFVTNQEENVLGQLSPRKLLDEYRYRKLNPKTKIYGLLGSGISKSKSYLFHNRYFEEHDIDGVYVTIEAKEEELSFIMKVLPQIGFCGLSVTAPFKEKILPFIDVFDRDAQEIGAVNTIIFSDRIYGANTDGKGALDSIEKRLVVRGKRCVIIGTGGVGKAIGYEICKRGGEALFFSRSLQNLHEIPTSYDLIVNATSVGSPITPGAMIPKAVAMDVGREETPFLQRAKQLGCPIIGGEEMFIAQAHGQYLRWGHILSS